MGTNKGRVKVESGIFKTEKGYAVRGYRLLESGRVLRSEKRVRTLSEARRVKAFWASNLANGVPEITTRRKGRSFESVTEDFIHWSQANTSVKNAETDQWAREKWLAYPGFQGIEIGEIGERDISAFKMWLTQLDAGQPKRSLGRKLSKRSVDIVLKRLRRLFTLAIREWKLRPDHPMANIREYNEDREVVRYLSRDEEVRLISACGPWLRKVITFCVNTGLRRDELLNLKAVDVDLEEGVIRITGKGGKERWVPLNQAAHHIVSPLIVPGKPERYVFGHQDGTKMTSINRTWYRAIEKSKVKNFRFHDLRHTFASRLAMNGISLQKIGELLGHSSEATTRRYAHLSRESLRESVRSLDLDFLVEGGTGKAASPPTR